MSNYKDFDLDLKEIKSTNTHPTPDGATLGFICTYILSKSVDYSLSKVIESYRECTQEDCRVPSRDYAHRSCRGALNDGTIQINC